MPALKEQGVSQETDHLSMQIYIFACQYQDITLFRFIAKIQNQGIRSLRGVCKILRLYLSLPIRQQYLQLIYWHQCKFIFYNSSAPPVHSSSQHDSLDSVEMKRYPLLQSRLVECGGLPLVNTQRYQVISQPFVNCRIT